MVLPMITRLSFLLMLAVLLALPSSSPAQTAPTRELRDLNKSYFPFTPVKSKEAWDVRKEEVKRRVLVASGLWPMPEKTPLNPVIHGRVQREDYTIDKVVGAVEKLRRLSPLYDMHKEGIDITKIEWAKH